MEEDEAYQLILRLAVLDSVIDFAKGVQQYKVLMAIVKRGRLGIEELSKETSITGRKLIDTIYKLRKKGLVDSFKRGDYVPTELGIKVYNDILRITGRSSLRGSSPPASGILRDTVIIAGSTWGNKVSYETLCKYFKTPISSIKRLLRPYTLRRNSVIKMQKGCVFLTAEGEKLFKDLTRSMGIGPLTAKVVTTLGLNSHPLKAMSNLFKVYVALTLASLILITTPFFVHIAACTLFLTLFFSTLLALRL